MMTAEEIAWITISRIRGVGPKTLWRLVDFLSGEHKTAVWLLEHPQILEDQLKPRCNANEILSTIRHAQSEMNNVFQGHENRVSAIHPLHPKFPTRLKKLRTNFSLPAILYTRGNADLFKVPSVSIVGARNAGTMAQAVTEKLAGEFARKKINVISGYAKGIDITAHISSLRENGTTTIVLSEGINFFKAKRDIKSYFTKENTLVVSQFEPNAGWNAHFAMTRNKLICALSSAIIVIVSGPERDSNGKMSGTFNEGLSALKIGTPTFVVSPNYFDDYPSGNSKLIEKGCLEFHPENGIAPILEVISQSSIKAPISHQKTKKSTGKRMFPGHTGEPDFFR